MESWFLALPAKRSVTKPVSLHAFLTTRPSVCFLEVVLVNELYSSKERVEFASEACSSVLKKCISSRHHTLLSFTHFDLMIEAECCAALRRLRRGKFR